MITNDREYAVTKEEAERFAQALAAADASTNHLTPRVRRAMMRGIELQLAELREALARYEAEQGGPTSAPTSGPQERSRSRSPEIREGFGLAAVLKHADLTLGDLAAYLNVPMSFAVKLQRGRVDPASLPQRFAARLGEFLGLAEEDVRQLVGEPSPVPTAGHWRAEKLPGPPPLLLVEEFREVMVTSPDLTDEHRREWLTEAT